MRRLPFIFGGLHLLAMVLSYIGLFIPSLSFAGRAFSWILPADLPISLPVYALAWKHAALALGWILVAGTGWWYLIGLAVRALLAALGNKSGPLKLMDRDLL